MKRAGRQEAAGDDRTVSLTSHSEMGRPAPGVLTLGIRDYNGTNTRSHQNSVLYFRHTSVTLHLTEVQLVSIGRT